MPRSLRRTLRSALEVAGLYGVVSRARRWPYRNVRSLRFAIDGREVEFGTDDPESHWWFFPRYARGRLHEPRVTLALCAALRGARCFADVGANLGWYTCVAAAHLPRGRVHAFEMDARNFGLLKENVLHNGFANVEANQVAVSDRTGTLSYRRPPGGLRAAFRLAGTHGAPQPGEEVQVPSLPLDAYFAARGEQPDVLKVDVEGAELQVLRGMRGLLEAHPPVLFLEVHPAGLASFGHSVSDVLGFLLERGYALHELESMRSRDAGGATRALGADSVLRENTMLRADPAQRRRSSSSA
jgi:FkbM family methyltransferase